MSRHVLDWHRRACSVSIRPQGDAGPAEIRMEKRGLFKVCVVLPLSADARVYLDIEGDLEIEYEIK